MLRLAIHSKMYVYTCIQVNKNSLSVKKWNIGMANTHKKQRRQERDGLFMVAR